MGVRFCRPTANRSADMSPYASRAVEQLFVQIQSKCTLLTSAIIREALSNPNYSKFGPVVERDPPDELLVGSSRVAALRFQVHFLRSWIPGVDSGFEPRAAPRFCNCSLVPVRCSLSFITR